MAKPLPDKANDPTSAAAEAVGLDPMDVYMSIAAMSYFNVSNRHTFSTIFGIDMTSKDFIEARRKSITDAVLRFVAADLTTV